MDYKSTKKRRISAFENELLLGDILTGLVLRFRNYNSLPYSPSASLLLLYFITQRKIILGMIIFCQENVATTTIEKSI